MRLRTFSLIALGLLCTLPLAGIANATHTAAAQGGRCEGVVTPISAGDVTVYLDDRGGFDQDDIIDQTDDNGLWLYLESNGVADLQRGGLGPVPVVSGLAGSDDRVCDQRHAVPPIPTLPDTLLF